MGRIYFDVRQARENLQRRAEWPDRDPDTGEAAMSDHPPMDVLETEDGLEVVLDVPGIDLHAITVTHRDGSVIVAGYKRPTRCSHGHAAFHLAERSFGRFARGVKLGGAFDPSRATATLIAGELRVRVPRIAERRGREIRIRIDTAETGSTGS